jgi:predicted nicotinamide N-methyase
MGLAPPYWAFAWAGGQALARYILDNPGLVAGKRVLDIGSGSGLVGIAAAKAGAATVLAADIDAFACAAIALNAAANGVTLMVTAQDRIGTPAPFDVILVGDLFYERPLAERLLAWLTPLPALVLLGDPGRTYFPRQGLIKLAEYQVPTTRELEDMEVKKTAVWSLP